MHQAYRVPCYLLKLAAPSFLEPQVPHLSTFYNLLHGHTKLNHSFWALWNWCSQTSTTGGTECLYSLCRHFYTGSFLCLCKPMVKCNTYPSQIPSSLALRYPKSRASRLALSLSCQKTYLNMIYQLLTRSIDSFYLFYFICIHLCFHILFN